MEYIRLYDLPSGVKGVTVEDEDGNANIYINSGLTGEAVDKTVAHEIYHARHNHIQSDTIPIIEKERTAKAAEKNTTYEAFALSAVRLYSTTKC